MTLPTFTLRQLLEVGVHFGHATRRWNPKMGPMIFGVRNGIHILDLDQTLPLLKNSLQSVSDAVAAGGRVLFVGTKRSAQQAVANAAQKTGQYHVNHRWLGGMLTNWNTIQNSIKRLKELDETLDSIESGGLTKRERLTLSREQEKLQNTLGGIRDMNGRPDIAIIIDVNKDKVAVQECNRLNIPIIGILDSNSDPQGVEYPIPGNDDAMRAINLYCDLFTAAIFDGLQRSLQTSGVDIGAAEEPIEDVEALEISASDEDIANDTSMPEAQENTENAAQ